MRQFVRPLRLPLKYRGTRDDNYSLVQGEGGCFTVAMKQHCAQFRPLWLP